MITELTYKLCGYISYTASTFGFVTPVFNDEKNDLYVQFSSGPNQLPEWNLLPDNYHAIVIKVDFKLDTPASFIYGFKKEDSLYFGDGKKMSEYLSSIFVTREEDGYELAWGFINDWPLLEPIVESMCKEEIWKKCLNVISRKSRTMPAIFENKFDVIDYTDGKLVLKSEDNNVRKVFETQFKQLLEDHFDKIIPSFKIEIVAEISHGLSVLPFVYFGGGEHNLMQGSYFLETRISPFKNFENFVVSDFNVAAYHQALGFIEKKNPSVLIVQGAAGVGKTHLVHSIAKRLISSQKNVGVYTVFSQPGSTLEMQESQIKQFENDALEKDVIIIDDVHNVKKEATTWVRIVKLLRKWREMNKSIILSYRDNYHIDIIPELNDNADHLYLTLPDESDKLSIIESRTNDLNIQLTQKDVIQLTEDKKVNIADIQKVLARAYLLKEVKHRTPKIYFTFNFDHIQPKSIDSCVNDYFSYNIISHIQRLRSSFVNAKVISHFIQDIFIAPHHGTYIQSRLPYVDGLYYSFDTLQHYIFESKEFRETLLDILLQLVSNKDDGSDIINL